VGRSTASTNKPIQIHDDAKERKFNLGGPLR